MYFSYFGQPCQLEVKSIKGHPDVGPETDDTEAKLSHALANVYLESQNEQCIKKFFKICQSKFIVDARKNESAVQKEVSKTSLEELGGLTRQITVLTELIDLHFKSRKGHHVGKCFRI